VERRDITEYKRSEEALRDESRILELLNETGIALSSKLELPAASGDHRCGHAIERREVRRILLQPD
jgi:hypothetical protein